MSLTVADSRVEEMQRALNLALRGLDRIKRIEGELAELRTTLDSTAEAIYNATLYDPEGVRDDAS